MPLDDRITTILESAQTHAARSVNSAQVLANWLVGKEIINEEQDGQERASYGQNIITNLAKKLKSKNIKGFSATNLRLCRQFHLEYPALLHGSISHSLRDQFKLPLASSINHAPSDELHKKLNNNNLNY